MKRLSKKPMTRKRYALIYGSLIFGCIGGMAALLIRKIFFGFPMDMLNIITMLILGPIIGYVWGDFAYLARKDKSACSETEVSKQL